MKPPQQTDLFLSICEFSVSLSAAAHHVEHPVVQRQVGFPSRQEEVVAEHGSLQAAGTNALHGRHHRWQRLPHGPTGQSLQEGVHADRTSSLEGQIWTKHGEED